MTERKYGEIECSHFNRVGMGPFGERVRARRVRLDVGRAPMLKPFWRYYGGKYRAAPRYPKPRHDTIVEPFAGAAGYSMRYPDRNVVLVEKYHVVAEIWRYLIGASPAEILSTPVGIDSVDQIAKSYPPGLRWLIGFAMNDAAATPRKTLSAGRKKLRDMGRTREGWSTAQRQLVADQVSAIRHWTVIEGDYTASPDVEATWFVDPPYQGRAGSHYKHPSTDLDYDALGAWCRSRRGQTIVCEAQGAAWLPFLPMVPQKSFGAGGNNTTSAEVVWTSRILDQLECR